MLAACQGCRVTSADLGFGFGHPAHGKRVAEQLFRDGADIFCHVAGQSGLGVLQAAANRVASRSASTPTRTASSRHTSSSQSSSGARRDILSGRLVVCDALNDPGSPECAALAPPT